MIVPTSYMAISLVSYNTELLHFRDGRHAPQEGGAHRPALLRKNDQNREAVARQDKEYTLASFQFRKPSIPVKKNLPCPSLNTRKKTLPCPSLLHLAICFHENQIGNHT